MTIKPSSQTVPPPKGGFLLRLACSSAGALLGLSVATAQTTPPATTTPDDTVKLDQYVVTGYRQSLATSLSAKRAASSNIDVITAEDAGKFPDINLAESLSHIPGVTVDRLFGEGERVSILGTDPNLNRTLLNGQPISSADWYVLDNNSRQFNYLLIAPDVVGKAEVYRTWEPRLLEGSIGGTVIVHTRDPLAGPPLVFAGTAGVNYNDRSEKNEWGGSAMVSWRNPEKTLGFMIGAQDQKEFLRRDGVEALALMNQDNLAVAGKGSEPGLPAGNWVTDEVVNSALFTQLRHRQGANATLSWKPTNELSIELTGLYVKQNMNNVNFSYYIYPGDNWAGITTVSNPVVTGGLLSSYTVNSAPLVIDAFNRAAEIKTQDYNAKLTYKQDTYTTTANLGYTRATGGTDHQFFLETFIFANANISQSASQASFSVTGVPGVDPTGANVNNGGDFVNPAGGNGGNIVANPEVDDEKWAQLDFEIPMTGAFSKVQVGGRYSEHKSSQTGKAVGLWGGWADPKPLVGIGAGAPPVNFLSGLPGITPSMSQHLISSNYGGVANYLSNLSATVGGGPAGKTALQYFDSGPAFNGQLFTTTPTFSVNEDIMAAYGEAYFGTGQLSGNVGVRWVQTKTSSTSYNLNTLLPITAKSTYDNVLPALNLAYELDKNQTLRFGVSEVIARPNTSAEANWVQLYDGTLGGVGGNVSLKPYKSVNTDLAYEYYFAKNSLFAVDVFYKDISNYILNSTFPETWFNAAVKANTTYNITRPGNGGAATSKGVALQFQQEWASGFGVQANYTRLWTTSANGPLPFSSKNQVNVSPYFENHWGLVRLVYTWRDEYNSSSFNGTSVVTTVPYTELDGNVEIKLHKNLSLVLDARNLLDETFRQKFVTSNGVQAFADAYKFGRTYEAKIHWNF